MIALSPTLFSRKLLALARSPRRLPPLALARSPRRLPPLALALALLLLLGSLARAQAPTSAVALDAERARLTATLGETASGLESALRTDDVVVAERLYLMERRAVELLEASAQVKYPTAAARTTAQAGLRSLVGRVLGLQERVQRHAMAELDRVLPGEPPAQRWTRDGKDLYRPLFRLGTPTPGQAPKTSKQAFSEMLQKFSDKGGSSADLHYLGVDTLAKLPSGKLAEWTQFGSDKIRFTTAGAKHPVIGLGRSVRGAGSMKVYRDARGEILLAVVSNSSGNYKPGAGATEGLAQKLAALGVPEAHILTTSIIPGEPELVKLVLKSKTRFTDDQIKDHVKALGARPASSVTTRALTAKPAKPLVRLGTGSPAARSTRALAPRPARAPIAPHARVRN